MKINGKIHLFFEQSGTFKNAFKKLGYIAEDYDIQNNYGETDHIQDIFAEIEKAYNNEQSIFDTIQCDDLIMAFFPCIYFSAIQATLFSYEAQNYRQMSEKEATERIIERVNKRNDYYILLLKLFFLCKTKQLRLIVENPATEPHYLLYKQNFPFKPNIIDFNRQIRGDYFKKPTAYWFVNCSPTYGLTESQPESPKLVKDCNKGKEAGICSEERSMISPTYARNFICDFILGKKIKGSQLDIF